MDSASRSDGSTSLPLLEEQRAAALSRLPDEVVSYYDSGAGAEVTRAESESAWSRFRLRPHVLRNVASTSTALALPGGQRLSTPLGVAPMAFHHLAHPDGELATARGTAAAGGLLVLSTRSSRSLEEVAEATDGAPWWFQVYVMKDRRLTEALVRRAAAAGAGALVLTGDTPYVGRKRRVAGVRLAVPDDHFLVNLAAHALPGQDATAQRAAAEQDPGIDLETISWLSGVCGLPVLVKGVLRGDDALACLHAGAAGVVVSNHGGRQLDRSLTSAVALAEVAGAVSGAGMVLVDGGVRSGTDALVALALGAHGVLVGRPVLWALAAGGSEAVAALIAEITDDLAHVMALAGAAHLGELTPDLVAGPE